ncbi:MAG: hypothetical protein ACRDJ4_15775 [Actinomycetota bacterium]
MRVRPVAIDAVEAVELAELLEFLGRWLDASDHEWLAGSISRFLGVGGAFDLDDLSADVARFASLLRGEDLGAGGEARR